jgi:hypothetical protein
VIDNSIERHFPIKVIDEHAGLREGLWAARV